MVLAIAMRILADVCIEQPGLVVLHLGKAIFELDSAILGGLDLRAGEGQSSFKPFEQVVVMPGMAVIAQDLDSRLRCFDNRLREVVFYSTPGKPAASSVYVEVFQAGSGLLYHRPSYTIR